MSGMRKKRKLRGRAERAAAMAAIEVEDATQAEAVEAEDDEAVEVEADDEDDDGIVAAAIVAEGSGAIYVDGDAEDDEALEAAGDGDEAEGEAGDAGDGAGGGGEGDAPAGADAIGDDRLASIVESLLFAANKPLAIKDLRSLLRLRDVPRIEAALEAVRARHEGHGIVLHEVAGGWQFRTASENSAWVQQLIAGRPVRLSRAQLETLAIVAYRQPITRPEIDEIRGVDSGSTLKVLLERDLIRILGKKEEPGRPLLYGTSRGFLEFFHLKDLRELPTLREFHELSEDSLRAVEAHDADAEDDDTVAPAADADASAEPIEAAADSTASGPIEAPVELQVDDGDGAPSEDFN